MTANAANRKDVRAAEKAARLAFRARAEVITNLMSTTPGRAWVWDLLTDCSVFVTTFTPEPSTAAFAEGRRSIGLAILADVMNACPDHYLTAAREANVRSTIREQSGNSNGRRDDSGSDSFDPDYARDHARYGVDYDPYHDLGPDPAN